MRSYIFTERELDVVRKFLAGDQLTARERILLDVTKCRAKANVDTIDRQLKLLVKLLNHDKVTSRSSRKA